MDHTPTSVGGILQPKRVFPAQNGPSKVENVGDTILKGHIMICQAVWSSAVPQLNAEIWTVARAYKESLFVEPSSPLCHVDVHGSQMPLNAMAIRNEVDLR